MREGLKEKERREKMSETKINREERRKGMRTEKEDIETRGNSNEYTWPPAKLGHQATPLGTWKAQETASEHRTSKSFRILRSKSYSTLKWRWKKAQNEKVEKLESNFWSREFHRIPTECAHRPHELRSKQWRRASGTHQRTGTSWRFIRSFRRNRCLLMG